MEERVVKEGFHKRVFEAVKQVPAGSVTTYGDVAASLGSPNVARHVGWALAACTDPEVPWHRVINAKGQISFRGDTERGIEQQTRLESEGIVFSTSGRVKLKELRHRFTVPDAG